jgi:aminoglycoside phosphotransferase family enzyme/predicted kinase
MDLPLLIAALSEPDAYPQPVDRVEVRQTHISVVFLAGEHVYKIKKPVNLGFLDFSTLEKRRHFCEEEVRLNRRLAPEVYLGVVPVTRRGESFAFEGGGEPVEWAVKMVRLPDDATLRRRLERGEVNDAVIRSLAQKLADFYSQPPTLTLPHKGGGDKKKARGEVADYGRFDVVAGNARENFAQSAGHIGATVSQSVFEQLRELTKAELSRLRPLIDARAERGLSRDTHGDLRLGHVYLLPGPLPHSRGSDKLVIIDCIEFNERFRFADPVADMAFVEMDLIFHGRRDLARTFADAYFAATGDAEGRELLPFYVAYRAAVRAKVDGVKAAESEVPEADRAFVRTRARAHWLLALGELAGPATRPGLVLVGGLPGTGKSTLARALADRAGFTVIRSDVVRKELAGRPPNEPTPADERERLYSAEWTARTYAECLRWADDALFAGRRVIVDATFADDVHRQQFLSLAARLAVPGVLLLCQADCEQVRKRLAERRGDASDADWAVYESAAARWQEPETGGPCDMIDTNGSMDAAALDALQRLAKRGLWHPPKSGGKA